LFYFRIEKVDNWENCCLSHIADKIKNECLDGAGIIRKEGKSLHIDAYRLFENKFVIVVKSQSKEDVEEVYKSLCINKLGDYTHDGIYLRLGCVYFEGTVGKNALQELVSEAEEAQKKVKKDLEAAATAVSMALNDVTGEKKVNVSDLAESSLKDFSNAPVRGDSQVSN